MIKGWRNVHPRKSLPCVKKNASNVHGDPLLPFHRLNDQNYVVEFLGHHHHGKNGRTKLE